MSHLVVAMLPILQSMIVLSRLWTPERQPLYNYEGY